jgi:hypothetical protein
MSLSLAEAAELVGRDKSTLFRSIQNGHLSGTKDALGQWRVEPAELHRVYPIAPQRGDNSETHQVTAAVTAALEAQIEGLKQVNTLLREQLDRECKHAELWREVATRQLPAPPAPAPEPPERKSWWRRIAKSA